METKCDWRDIERLLRKAAQAGDERQVALCNACQDLEAELSIDEDGGLVTYFWRYMRHHASVPANWIADVGGGADTVKAVNMIIAMLEREHVVFVDEDGMVEIL